MRCFDRIAVALTLFSLSAAMMGQTASSVPSASTPGPLLPKSFGVWKQSSVTDLPACNARGTDACASDKEFGLKRGSVASYERSDRKAAKLTVEARDMIDATGTYAAFTLSRDSLKACAKGAAIGNDCASGPGHLLFWQGETLVDVHAEGGSAVRASEMQPLLEMLPKPTGTKAALPILPVHLPQAGLDVESVRYALGRATYAHLQMPVAVDAMGFEKSAEVVTAQYRGPKSGNGMLAIAFYPTNQIAGDRARAIEADLKKSGHTAVRRVTNMVAIAYGGFTEAQAKTLVGKVSSTEKLTLQNSEMYQPHTETLQTSVSILSKIVLFVIGMTLAALVLGVFFGGGRALVRKLQGKPLSSLEDMEIIKLELGGKPSTKPRRDDSGPEAT